MRESTVTIGLMAATAAAAVIAVVSPLPIRHAIGSAGLGLTPVVLGLAAASLGARSLGRYTTASVLAFLARLAVWLLLARLIAEPAPTVVDAAASWLASLLAPIAAGVRTALGAIAGLLLLGAVVGSMMGGQSAPTPATSKSTVRTGSSLGPVAAGLLRLASRASITLFVLALWLLLAAGSWTVAGIAGLRIALGRLEAISRPQRGIAFLAASLSRGGTGVAALLKRRSTGWGRHESLGAWLSPVAIERDAAGDRVDAIAWLRDPREDAEERELRELTSALVAAFDVALVSGGSNRKGSDGGQDPRQQAPRPYPYRIEALRAWSRPGFHAVVIRATPTTANAVLAKVTAEQLLPTLDAETSWTATELRGLRLSDRRVADDPLRGGEPGVFVALERHVPLATSPSVALDPGQAAIERALKEAGLAERYRLARTDIGFDADTYEYRASFSTSTEWRELETSWKALTPSVALFARESGVRMETRLEPYGFLAVIPKPTPEFPSGEATDWSRVVTRYEPVLRKRPLSFVMGLDHRGEPLIMELGTQTPHLLVAGSTGSGKSRSAVFSPLAQLMRTHEPTRLRMWLLDSVKRELSSLFGDSPFVERRVVAEDGDDVVALLEAFTASMDARYRDQAGREFDLKRDAAQLLVVEEWADLRDLLDKDQLERVIRAMNRVGELGRAAGHHAILVTQKASAEVIPPRLKTNFKGRVAGYLEARDNGIVFDVQRRLLPNVKGRLAVSLGGNEIHIVQGLYIDNPTIRGLVEGQKAGAPSAPILVPVPVLAQPTEPRAPTAREVETLDLRTLARLIYRWQAELDDPLVVSVRTIVDRVRSLGHTPGRVERYTVGLGELERLGILGRTSDGAQSPRRVAVDWERASVILEHAESDWRSAA
ncbi:MAG: FtsK/SpoIIIE domain-containing protein [Candidatus Limnocylindrales bacterium]